MDTPFLNITTHADTRYQIKDQIKDQIKIKQQTRWQVQNSKVPEIKKQYCPTTRSKFKKREKIIFSQITDWLRKINTQIFNAPPMCKTCSTTLSIKYTSTECGQYTNDPTLFNIPRNLGTSLGPRQIPTNKLSIV